MFDAYFYKSLEMIGEKSAMKKTIKMMAKQVIRRELLPDLLANEALEEKVTVDNNYRIKPSTLFAFDCQLKPIQDKYQTVVFDQEEGLILLEKMTTRSLFYQAYKTAPERELTIKKFLSRLLNVTGQHVQAFGSYAYFSFFSLRNRPLDLVSLHQMRRFDCSQEMGHFLTLDCRYAFETPLPARKGSAWTLLQDAITLNAACLELLRQRASMWGCQLKTSRQKSLLTDPAYQRSDIVASLKEVDLYQLYQEADSKIIDLCSDSFYQEFADEIDKKCWKIGDLHNLLAKCSRNYIEFK